MPDVTLLPPLVTGGLYVIVKYLSQTERVWTLYYHEGSVTSSYLIFPDVTYERGNLHTVKKSPNTFGGWYVDHTEVYSMNSTSHFVIGCVHLGNISNSDIPVLNRDIRAFDAIVRNNVGHDPTESWALRVIQELLHSGVIRFANPHTQFHEVQPWIRWFVRRTLADVNLQNNIPRPVVHCDLFA
ncbi:hypothetical protein CPC08DRAFT_717481 [Agrocybe pediades]|nr:hypothetical protein CPC08DRAFT_717481 [Agrocybe pediades]